MDSRRLYKCAAEKHTSRRRATLAVCAALLLAATRAWAQEPVPQAEQTPPFQPVAQSAIASALTTIHGVVRNAATGEPLPRALVRIEGEEIGALTDGEGRFEIVVKVGPQIIRIHKPGFNDRPYATEDVGYQNDGPAHSVLVVAGMAELNFTLTPTSAIHGRVTLSTGDPAQGIQITLLKQVVRNGRAVWAQNGSTKTNGSGAYRFAGLPAGVYALFTQPTLESESAATAAAGAKAASSGFPSVYYPEAREFSGAARIRLVAGQQAEANLLLPLEPFYPVTATAILPNGKPFTGVDLLENIFSSSPQILVLVQDASGQLLNYIAHFDQAKHAIRASLPGGSYTFVVVASTVEQNDSGQGNVRSSHKSQDLWGIAEFSVEGHAVNNLRIPLIPEPSWPIHLRVVRTTAQDARNTGQKAQLVSVTANDAEGTHEGGSSTEARLDDTAPDMMTLKGAGLVPQWISTQPNDRSLCVESFSAGGINLAREPLNIALGASPPPMEITLSDNCAKLALTLPPALAEFLPGDEPFYTVYVVPDFDTTTDIPPMNLHPSSGATLTVDGLTPGSYHVYVFDRPLRLEYRNPAALAALPTPGQQVTLSAGATGNLVLEVPGR